jgi:cell division protein FtsZ
MSIEFSDENDVQQYVAHLKVVGVGGGGVNAVNRMVTAGVQGVELIAANTDYKSLKTSLAAKKLQLGKKSTRGLGSGGDPTVGREAAIESTEEIQKTLQGADMVFVAAGLGGGTGTGSAPVVAEVAKKMGILTVGVVTRPFEFEGPVRKSQAEDGLKLMLPNVDAVIIIPNERLNLVCEADTDFFTAFHRADEVLLHAIQGIAGVIHSEGFINRDFADVKRILTAKGKVLMGSGYGTGDDRAMKAVKQAVNSPLLEDVDIAGANAILVQVTAGNNFTLNEFNQICGFLQKAARPDAEIVPGMVRDENLHDGIRVTIIATGFAAQSKEVQVEDILDFSEYVRPNRQAVKPQARVEVAPPRPEAVPVSSDAQEGDTVLRMSEGQYDIPAYLRKRLAGKPIQN